MTATQTETLRTIRTLVDANGGTTKLSRKPVKRSYDDHDTVPTFVAAAREQLLSASSRLPKR
jgi:hypothetical protein